MIGSAAAILGLTLGDAVSSSTAYVLLIIPVALGVQYYRVLQRTSAVCGNESAALGRYNRGIMLTSLGYMLGMGIAISLWDRFDLSPPVVFAISLLPAIPTFAMIWVMGRYIAGEADEYLRHRAIISALWGLCLVLALGTFWGFMEMFDLVPHIWAWWVMPVWAIGMGLGQSWIARRDQAPVRSDYKEKYS